MAAHESGYGPSADLSNLVVTSALPPSYRSN